MEGNSWRRRTVLKGIGGAAIFGGVVGRVGAASTIKVPQDYSTISDAVASANPGDTVLVGTGDYREQVIVRKDLTVRGQGNPTLLPPDGNLGVGDIAVIQPIFGAVGYGNDVTFEGFTVDGEGATDKGGFYSSVGYYKADGAIRDCTLKGADYGAYVSQNRGGGGDQNVHVRNCQFEDLGLGRGTIGETQLVFNEPGTTGKITGSTFVAEPNEYPLIYGISIGYGASVDVQRNTFRDFYSEDGFGIGAYAFNAPDCTVQKNDFDTVQYPFYATASSGVNSNAGQSRVVHNDFDGSGLPDGVTSYGTTLYAYDTDGSDGRVENVNNVKVVNNEYTGFDFGIASFTGGDGVVQNTKIIRNEFENVDTPITDNGEETKQHANRI